MNAHENNTDGKSKALILSQEEANEKIRTSFTHLIRQLEDLTSLMWGMSGALMLTD